jgi:hypothetical protein
VITAKQFDGVYALDDGERLCETCVAPVLDKRRVAEERKATTESTESLEEHITGLRVKPLESVPAVKAFSPSVPMPSFVPRVAAVKLAGRIGLSKPEGASSATDKPAIRAVAGVICGQNAETDPVLVPEPRSLPDPFVELSVAPRRRRRNRWEHYQTNPGPKLSKVERREPGQRPPRLEIAGEDHGTAAPIFRSTSRPRR